MRPLASIWSDAACQKQSVVTENWTVNKLFPLAAEYDERHGIPGMLIRYSRIQRAGFPARPQFYLGIFTFLTSLFFILHGVSLMAQALDIRLVDGRNGRPMVGKSSYVNVWVGTERKAAIVVPTDGKGFARIQLTSNTGEVNISNSTNSGTNVVEHPIVKYDELLQINVPYALCESEKSSNMWLGLLNFSTKEIFQHGYASPNTCGTVTVSPQPGQLILFVRPLTFWEKMKQ